MTGEQLKKMRLKLGYTQDQMAEKLGYFSKGKPNRSMIARFENNHAKINSRIASLIDFIFNTKSSK